MIIPEFPTAVLLIAHGSRRPEANADLHALADRIAARGDYPIAVAAFLELAEPDIVAGGDRCVALGARRVLLVPYFLAAGVHLGRDLAAARDELARRHPGIEFRLGPALGPHPLLDQLVLERIRQTDAAPGGGDPPGPGAPAAAAAERESAPLSGLVPDLAAPARPAAGRP